MSVSGVGADDESKAAENLPEKMTAKDLEQLDYFAGCALTGIIASMGEPVKGSLSYSWPEASRDAYVAAECMMKEREKRKQPQRLGSGKTLRQKGSRY